MNDYEKLKKTFEEIGVEFTETVSEEVEEVEYDGGVKTNKRIHLENGIGYYSFVCEFYFLDDKYQGHGVWE